MYLLRSDRPALFRRTGFNRDTAAFNRCLSRRRPASS